MDVRYNLPTSRDETCKFDLKATVKEIKEKDGELFGPVQNDAREDGDEGRGAKKKTAEKKKKGGKRKKGCKGKKRNKKRCGKKENKSKNKKKQPPKHQPVKTIHLKVCTR